jgi:hypothetical protein
MVEGRCRLELAADITGKMEVDRIHTTVDGNEVILAGKGESTNTTLLTLPGEAPLRAESFEARDQGILFTGIP